MNGLLTGYVVFATGALLLVWHRYGSRTRTFAARLATVRGNHAPPGAAHDQRSFGLGFPAGSELPGWLSRRLAAYRDELRLAGGGKSPRRLLLDKLIAAGVLPLILVVPYTAVVRQPPPLLLDVALAAAGFFVPDLGLRRAVRRRREQMFLDLPEALAMIALGLGAGQSLRQALALAARDCRGPLGTAIAAALTRARREPHLDERQALVQVARETGEPHLLRFAELLAAKESPYLDFLATHAAQARTEQQRLLERAADRAYLNMHAPIAPLLTTLVLVVAYGFLHLLESSI